MVAQPADAQPGGVLIQFPGPDRTCFVCPHHEDRMDSDDRSPGLVSWCTAFDQPIDSEAYEAEDCDLFEIDPEKVQ
jgi:hypothetical protein